MRVRHFDGEFGRKVDWLITLLMSLREVNRRAQVCVASGGDEGKSGSTTQSMELYSTTCTLLRLLGGILEETRRIYKCEFRDADSPGVIKCW